MAARRGLWLQVQFPLFQVAVLQIKQHHSRFGKIKTRAVDGFNAAHRRIDQRHGVVGGAAQRQDEASAVLRSWPESAGVGEYLELAGPTALGAQLDGCTASEACHRSDEIH